MAFINDIIIKIIRDKALEIESDMYGVSSEGLNAEIEYLGTSIYEELFWRFISEWINEGFNGSNKYLLDIFYEVYPKDRTRKNALNSLLSTFDIELSKN